MSGGVFAGFGNAVHAEWTKLRTVRGWVIALVVGPLLIVGLGLAPGAGGTCGKQGPGSECELPVGPDGTEVTDVFTFVHQSLAGDGSITVRVASLTGRVAPVGGPGDQRVVLTPWAKAGLVVKANTRPGSAYAALMVTAEHGVRMQYDYTHDVAGPTGAAPRWLRLTRSGSTMTGACSADGTHWTTVGTAHLNGLPATVQAGLFTTSPPQVQAIGAAGAESGPTLATATFERPAFGGQWATPAGAASSNWRTDQIGGPPDRQLDAGATVSRAGDRFTVTGSGDIAPAVSGAAGLGISLTQTLIGTFAGLILVVVIGALFVATEYRRGLVRTTLVATPARGRVLAAKALVVAAVCGLAGVVAATIVVTAGKRVLTANGAYVNPTPLLTDVRLVLGTGALLAVAAVLALGLGTLFRRGAAAVTAAVVVVVLPYLLAISILPPAAGDWLLRVSPAAAFAVQQSARQWAQVDNVYTVNSGYFPLAPWAGFAVLCAWAVVSLALAAYALRRRDA